MGMSKEIERTLTEIKAVERKILELEGRILSLNAKIERDVNELKGAMGALARGIEGVNSKLETLISLSRETIKGIDRCRRELKDEVSSAREDLAVRLVLLKASLVAMEYLEYRAASKSLEALVRELDEKLGQAMSEYRERYAEIMHDYIRIVDDMLSQFIAIAQEEFDLLERVLRLKSDIDLMYTLLSPEEVDKRVLHLAVNVDVRKRMEVLRRVVDMLREAAARVEAASTSSERLVRQLVAFEVKGIPAKEDRLVLLLPVTRVKVRVGSEEDADMFGPTLSPDAPPELAEKLVGYVGDRVEEFPLELSPEVVERIRGEVLKLARDEEERKFLEEALKGVVVGAGAG